MWTLVYVNAVAAALIVVVAFINRRPTGLLLVLFSAAMQVGAFRVYTYKWSRLAGQPDRLYVWIVPTLMQGLSIAMTIGAIIRNMLPAWWPVREDN